MSAFLLSPGAAQDIEDICDFIAQDSNAAADRVRREILDAMQGLANMSGKGHTRKDLTSRNVLFWTIRSYQIIYSPETKPLKIHAVLHGKRNLRRILKDR